jgi:N-acylneuraminate cytidylyltransferase
MKTIALISLIDRYNKFSFKNIKLLGGRPLCDWSIKSCIDSNVFDEVWISTDSLKISEIASKCGANVHIIDKVTDVSSSVSIIYDFLLSHDTDIIFLVQATSPFVYPIDFINGKEKFMDENCDLLISCVDYKSFIWRSNENLIKPLKNTIKKQQCMKKYFEEDGSFYVFTKDTFMTENNIPFNLQTINITSKFNKHITIDEPIDFELCEFLVNKGYGHK